MLPITLTGLVRCLIVGGGNVALRKARWLRENTRNKPVLDLIAPALCPEFQEDAALLEAIRWEKGTYQTRDLSPYRLVFACTNDPAVNRQAASEARAAGCLVNVADAPELCDFFVPATLRRDDLCIAFSAGAAPSLAAALREEAERQYPVALGELAARIRTIRQELRSRFPDSPAQRTRILQALSSADARARWLAAPTLQDRESLLQSILQNEGDAD